MIYWQTLFDNFSHYLTWQCFLNFIFFLHNFHVGHAWERERKGGWFMTEVGEGQREREAWKSWEKWRAVYSFSIPKFVLPPSPKCLLRPSPKFILPPFPKCVVLPFSKLFFDGFVIYPLVEQKKYWVYSLQQICGLGFRFVERRHFCFPFWRIFDKVCIFCNSVVQEWKVGCRK